jgi:hypothetical protein
MFGLITMKIESMPNSNLKLLFGDFQNSFCDNLIKNSQSSEEE